MPVNKTALKVTNGECVFKVEGTAAAAIIDLQTELFPYGSRVTPVGTVTIGTGATSVVGVGTNFTADWVGAKLYNTSGVYVGIVASYTNATSIALAANGAVAISGAGFRAEFQTQKLDGATQRVNITALTWSGAANGVVAITRNGVTIATLQANSPNFLEFEGQDMVNDSVSNDQDITVTISGAQAECWIKMKKVSGWKGTLETAVYGSYDDPIAAGA